MSRRFAALLIIAALLGGGVAHASVIHNHGTHSHDEGESSIWATLHSSLRHEDKHALFVLSESFVLAFFAYVAIVLVSAVSMLYLHAMATRRDPYAQDALRRGIYRYRVFV